MREGRTRWHLLFLNVKIRYKLHQSDALREEEEYFYTVYLTKCLKGIFQIWTLIRDWMIQKRHVWVWTFFLTVDLLIFFYTEQSSCIPDTKLFRYWCHMRITVYYTLSRISIEYFILLMKDKNLVRIALKEKYGRDILKVPSDTVIRVASDGMYRRNAYLYTLHL